MICLNVLPEFGVKGIFLFGISRVDQSRMDCCVEQQSNAQRGTALEKKVIRTGKRCPFLSEDRKKVIRTGKRCPFLSEDRKKVIRIGKRCPFLSEDRKKVIRIGKVVPFSE